MHRLTEDNPQQTTKKEPKNGGTATDNNNIKNRQQHTATPHITYIN